MGLRLEPGCPEFVNCDAGGARVDVVASRLADFDRSQEQLGIAFGPEPALVGLAGVRLSVPNSIAFPRSCGVLADRSHRCS